MRILVRIRVTISNYFVEKLLVSDKSPLQTTVSLPPYVPEVRAVPHWPQVARQTSPARVKRPFPGHVTWLYAYIIPNHIIKNNQNVRNSQTRVQFELVKRSFRIWQFAFFGTRIGQQSGPFRTRVHLGQQIHRRGTKSSNQIWGTTLLSNRNLSRSKSRIQGVHRFRAVSSGSSTQSEASITGNFLLSPTVDSYKMTLREENFVLFNGVIDEVFSTKNNLKDLEELNWIASGLTVSARESWSSRVTTVTHLDPVAAGLTSSKKCMTSYSDSLVLRITH